MCSLTGALVRRLAECSLLSHASITIKISPCQAAPGASASAPSGAHAGESQDTALASPSPAAAVARDAEGAGHAHGAGAAGREGASGGGGWSGGGVVIEKEAWVCLLSEWLLQLKLPSAPSVQVLACHAQCCRMCWVKVENVFCCTIECVLLHYRMCSAPMECGVLL